MSCDRRDRARRLGSIVLLLGLVAPLLTAAPADATITATVVELDTLGGALSLANDINDAGVIVGSSTDGSDRFRAFVQEPGGSMLDIGTLGGQTAEAHAVNAQGIVVGQSTLEDPLELRAFRYDTSTGEMTQIGPSMLDTIAWDVADNGLTVGWSYPGDSSQGFVYDPADGSTETLPSFSLPTSSAAYGTDGRRAVGYVTEAGEELAVSWDLATRTPTRLPELSPDQIGSHAWSMNDSGLAGGSIQRPGGPVPVIWDLDAGTVRQLADLGFGGEAMAINDRGIVVGSVRTPESSAVAAAWDLHTGEMFLIPPNGPHGMTLGINESNQVVGWRGSVDDARAFEATLQTPPGAPLLTGSGCLGSWVVSWTPPFDGNLPITGYGIHRDGVLVEEVPSDVGAFGVTALAAAASPSATPAVAIAITVAALNANGASVPSEAIVVEPCASAPGPAPPASPLAIRPSFTG
jgi:probable HAF family extracellular repeat protein